MDTDYIDAKIDAVLRHGDACMWKGRPIGPPHSRHDGESCIPLSSRDCVCDPHGAKARAHALVVDRYSRNHVLFQDELWYPNGKPAIRVEDMSLRYLKNVLAFLERRAPRLKAAHELELMYAPGVQGEHALDAVGRLLDESLETLPTTWLYQQPLVVRIEALIRAGHDGPID